MCLSLLFFRWQAALPFAVRAIFTLFLMAQPASANPPANRAREMERLIDAVASRNLAPKLIGERGFAYPAFSKDFHWEDQKRVQAAEWTLAQDASNDLIGCLVKHFHDKRYSATCELNECYPENYTVGDICEMVAEKKLMCAYLRHLKPGGTAHYGGPTFNYVPEGSRDFLPDSLQRELHYSSPIQTHDGFAKWYQARRDKPLYELQIEMCEWAIKKAKNAKGIADKPKKEFIAAVKNQIESLKKNKKPIVDPSRWSATMSDGYWKFYTEEDARWTRDTVLKRQKETKAAESATRRHGQENKKPEKKISKSQNSLPEKSP
jgi:hypothetical protein